MSVIIIITIIIIIIIISIIINVNKKIIHGIDKKKRGYVRTYISFIRENFYTEIFF